MSRWTIKKEQLRIQAGLPALCVDCGGRYDDFHHIDPQTKSFTISRGLRKYSNEQVIDEMKKCVPLCKPCHNGRHHK